MPLSEIVDVNISRESTTVDIASFNTGMFLGLHKNFTEVAKAYASTSELLADGFQSTDPEYKAAVAYFGQELRPTELIIGRRATNDSMTVTPTAAAASGVVYTVKVNGTTYTYTSAGVETQATVATNFAAIITANVDVNASASLGVITIVPAVAATPYSVQLITSNLTKGLTASGSWASALQAVYDAGLNWYTFGTYSHLPADILDIAAWASSNTVIYGYSTSNTTDTTSTTTGIMAQLQALGYDRAYGLWNAEATNDAAGAGKYPEMAWMGDRLVYAPGSDTWMFKDLSGVAVDALSTTASSYIRGYSGNTYERIGGANITREGKVASGEYIDIIRGIDWLDARMTERIYSRLVNLQKIPYTGVGVQIIVTEIRGALEEGITNGLIDGATPYTITVPKVLDVSPTMRAAREFPAIKFTARLAGAIHKIEVSGVVSV